MLIRFIAFFLLLVLIDWYFFQSVKTISVDWSAARRDLVFRLYWGFSILSFALGVVLLVSYNKPFLPKGFMMYAVSIIMVVMVSKLIGSLFLVVEDAGRMLRWMANLMHKPALASGGSGESAISRATFLSYTAISLAAVPFASFLYGMAVTAFDFKIRRARIHIPHLPAGFEGMKIVQISDLHSGSFVSDEPFRKAVDLIMQENPDLVVFTGDLVNDRAAEAEPFIETWKKLSAPMGVYSILGNHDYGDYVVWDSKTAKAENLNRLKEIHGEMNWNLLLNEGRVLERNGDRIGLLGVENWGEAMRFPRKGDINKARKGLPEVPVKILLSHDPSHWDAQVRNNHPDIDLTLSGHTHGFQFGIEIPGFKWSPSQWIYKQWAGLYSSENQHIYVNRGLGFIGYLGRVGIKPEITVLELSATESPGKS
jgi:uncharacterized protein